MVLSSVVKTLNLLMSNCLDDNIMFKLLQVPLKKNLFSCEEVFSYIC